jgi:hypothetical protein
MTVHLELAPHGPAKGKGHSLTELNSVIMYGCHDTGSYFTWVFLKFVQLADLVLIKFPLSIMVFWAMILGNV